MGRKNVKNMQKANKICYYFGGESKGPEKNNKKHCMYHCVAYHTSLGAVVVQTSCRHSPDHQERPAKRMRIQIITFTTCF